MVGQAAAGAVGGPLGGAAQGHFVKAKSDTGLSAADQSLAGAAAQAVTKTALHPLDTLKSWRQANKVFDVRGLKAVTTTVYRGVVPKICLYSPYQAVYMATYTHARDVLVADGSPVSDGAAFVLSGVTAEIVGSLVRLPMEVAKLRLQLGVYRHTWHAAQELLSNPRHFYGNFVPQTLLHDCIFSACSWFLFEQGRQWIFARRHSSELALHESLALGATSGGVSAVLTTPFDVLKTRVVGKKPTATSTAPGFREIRATAVQMWRTEGARVFWRGWWLRVLHCSPSQGLYMLLYDIAKTQISAWRRSTSGPLLV